MAHTIEKIKAYLVHRMSFSDEFQRINSTINLQLLSCYSYSSPAIFLDCGCGLGDNLADLELHSNGFHRILGLDINLPSLTECRRCVSDKVTLLCANGLDIPLLDQSVDTVLSNQVIEHISEYRKYLMEVARVMKAEGLFVVSTPNSHCPRNTVLKLFGRKPIMRWSNIRNFPPEKFRGHTQEFSETELRILIENHGFKLIKSLPILPRPSLTGNLLFNVYTFAEYILFILSRPFVAKGYSKNNNMLFQRFS